MKKGNSNKQIRRMLGVAMAMVMLLGSNLSVLAATYNFTALQVGDTLESGDEVYNDFGVYVYIEDENSDWLAYLNPSDSYTMQDYYEVVSKYESVSSGGALYVESVAAPMVPGTNPGEKEKKPVAPAHIHDYNWEVVKEPTLKEEGLAQDKCQCGAVNAQQPISSATAFVKMVCDAIEKAPADATVVVESEIYTCYTAKIMDVLKERADVNLRTIFFAEDGTKKSFTIPAGAAPTDDILFYGFTGLGNTYGWEE